MSTPAARTTPTPLTADQHEQLLALECRLSPENLSCDGECSRAEANRRWRAATAAWRALEKQVGRPVDASELWAREREIANTGARAPR